MADNKYKRRRKRAKAEGWCWHCGKPCAPYYECAERRAYKNRQARLRQHQKAGKQLDLILKDLLRISPPLDEDPKTWVATVIMLSCLFIRPTTRYMVAFTGYREETVSPILSNLKGAGIVKERKPRMFCSWVDEAEKGDALGLFVGILLDALVGLGVLTRARDRIAESAEKRQAQIDRTLIEESRPRLASVISPETTHIQVCHITKQEKSRDNRKLPGVKEDETYVELATKYRDAGIENWDEKAYFEAYT